MDCPACGAPNEDNALFCGSCGTTLSPAEDTAQQTLAEATAAVEAGRDETFAPAATPRVAAPQPRVPGTLYAAPAPTVPTSGQAIASLVLGIGGLTFLPLVGSIIAVILGPMARSEIRRRPDQVSGDGVALVGMILGWIGIGLTVLGLLLFGAITVCALVGAFGAAWPAN